VQLLQLGDFRLQLGKSGGGDVIGLRADLPFDWLIGLRSSASPSAVMTAVYLVSD